MKFYRVNILDEEMELIATSIFPNTMDAGLWAGNQTSEIPFGMAVIFPMTKDSDKDA